MWDESDAKVGVVGIDNRQADAVDSDRPLAGHVPHEVEWTAKMKESPIPFLFSFDDFPDSIDMAGDKMPPQTIASLEGSFAVDLTADREIPKPSSRKGFGTEFKAAVRVSDRDNGKTTTRKADTIPDHHSFDQRSQIEDQSLSRSDPQAFDERDHPFD